MRLLDHVRLVCRNHRHKPPELVRTSESIVKLITENSIFFAEYILTIEIGLQDLRLVHFIHINGLSIHQFKTLILIKILVSNRQLSGDGSPTLRVCLNTGKSSGVWSDRKDRLTDHLADCLQDRIIALTQCSLCYGNKICNICWSNRRFAGYLLPDIIEQGRGLLKTHSINTHYLLPPSGFEYGEMISARISSLVLAVGMVCCEPPTAET